MTARDATTTAGIRRIIRDVVEEVLGDTLVDTDEDVPLRDLFPDSVSLIEAVRHAHAQLGVVIPLQGVLDGSMTIAMVADAVASVATTAEQAGSVDRLGGDPSAEPDPPAAWERTPGGGTGVGARRMAYLEREAELPPGLAPARRLAPYHPAPARTVLVTGGTGYLGSWIVSRLLHRTDVDVVCLVRARRGADGMARLRRSAVRYGAVTDATPWPESWQRRLRVVAGDVLLPQLGMEQDEYAVLSRGVDTIVHSAAAVDFLSPYEALRATNVGGVHEVIRFAFAHRIKEVHHVSTAAVWPPGSGRVFGERDDLRHGGLLNLGYYESKWVAERSLEHAADRGLPLVRYRPGEVGGDSLTGRSPTRQLMVAALCGFVQLGVVPELDVVLDVAPVDFVTDAIVELAFGVQRTSDVYHLTNPGRCPLAEATDVLRRLGYELDTADYLRARASLLNSHDFLDNPLYPFQTLFEEFDVAKFQTPSYDTDAARRDLASSGITCPPLDERLIRTYVGHLSSIGRLPQPALGTDRVSVKR